MLARNITLRIGLLLFTSTIGIPAHAERVYQLVNYPALQYGHTLSGTITTTDDAPMDGILNTPEIINWQWSVTGPGGLSASSSPTFPYVSVIAAQGVAISATVIELPQTNDTLFLLSERWESGRGPFANSLSWFSRLNTNSLYSAASKAEGDVSFNYWITELDVSTQQKHVIANLVPEPATILLAVALLVVASIRRILGSGCRNRF